MFNFDFSEKDLGIVSPPHFVYMIFQEKCLSCYILLNYKNLILQFIIVTAHSTQVASVIVWFPRYSSPRRPLLSTRPPKSKRIKRSVNSSTNSPDTTTDVSSRISIKSFSSAKVKYMKDSVQPTLREMLAQMTYLQIKILNKLLVICMKL